MTLDDAWRVAVEHLLAGRLAQAEPILRAIVEAAPGHPEAHYNLGIIAKRGGRLAEALQYLERASRLKPDFAECHDQLGILQRNLGRDVEAVESFRRAVALGRDDATLHERLGDALMAAGRPDEAAESFRQAVARDPRRAERHNALGGALRAAGRRDDALASYRRALELDPDYAQAYRNYVLVHRGPPAAEVVEAMERLHGRGDVGDDARMHLGFALAKVFDAAGRFDDASRYLLSANALKRDTYRYDPADDLATAEQLMALFDRRLFDAHPAGGVGDETPIFIVGMPRSGSTLVERILAAHPSVVAGGELPILGQLVQHPDPAGGDPLAWLADPEPALLVEKGREYLRRRAERVPHGGERVTDKMPRNFWLVGFIRLVLPAAKIIHVTRDPRDTCLSIFSDLFVGHQPYAYDLKELAAFHRLYQRMMAHWNEVLPGYCYDIAYESLVGDPEGEIRRLLDHCGLPFDARCLDSHEGVGAVQTASAEQVRQPIHRRSVGRWRNYRSMLEPLLERLAEG